MGFFRKAIREVRDLFEEGDAEVVRWLYDGGTSLMSKTSAYTGRTMTPQAAVSVAAFDCGARAIAESLAVCPLFLYRAKPGGGKEKASDHPLYRVLHSRPHPRWTHFDFIKHLVLSQIFHGDAFCLVVRIGGKIDRLIPIHPHRVRVELIDIYENGDPEIVFFYCAPNIAEVPLFQGEMLHWKFHSIDGIRGVSFIAKMKETLALSAAAEEYGSRFFSNGASPRFVLKHPAKLKPDGKAALRESFERFNQGLGNAHRIAVLEEGMDLAQMSINPVDAQSIETRGFTVTDIARGFRVAPHKLMDLTHATFSNIEHQGMEFVQDAVLPWAVSGEETFERDLLTDDEQLIYTACFELKGLERGDMATRFAGYNTARNGGWMNGDEIRALEDMEPMPDGLGEIFWRPANMEDASEPPVPTMPSPTPASIGKDSAETAKPTDAKKAKRELSNLILNAIKRCVKKEAKATQNAADKVKRGGSVKEFETWTTEFYRRHISDMKAEIEPVITAYRAVFGGSEINLEDILVRYVDGGLGELAAYRELDTGRACVFLEGEIIGGLQRDTGN